MVILTLRRCCSQVLLTDRARETDHIDTKIQIQTHRNVCISVSTYVYWRHEFLQLPPIPIQHHRVHSSLLHFHVWNSILQQGYQPSILTSMCNHPGCNHHLLPSLLPSWHGCPPHPTGFLTSCTRLSHSGSRPRRCTSHPAWALMPGFQLLLCHRNTLLNPWCSEHSLPLPLHTCTPCLAHPVDGFGLNCTGREWREELEEKDDLTSLMPIWCPFSYYWIHSFLHNTHTTHTNSIFIIILV